MSCISASATRVGGISASATRVGGISASATRVGGISVGISLVCEVSQGKYLRVKPEDVQWLIPYLPIEYNIHSNTDWNLT